MKRRSILRRVIVVVLGAGLVSLVVSALAVLSAVHSDQEAFLVDSALHQGELLRERVDGRVETIRTQLRSLIASEQLAVTGLVAMGVESVRVLSEGEVVLDASRSEEASALLRVGDMLPSGTQLIVAEENDSRRAEAILDLSEELAVPPQWRAHLVPQPHRSRIDVRASRLEEGIQVRAPSARASVAVLIEAPLAPVQQAAIATAARTAMWSLLAVIPLFFLAILLGFAVTRPIRGLVDAVETAGDQPVRLPDLPADEIGELGDAIAAMSARLHEDARALRAAVGYGRQPERWADPREVLHALEETLREVFHEGEWRVVEGSTLEHGDVEVELATLARAAIKRADPSREVSATELPEGKTAIVLRNGPQVYGVALGAGGSADHGELLCQTAVASIRNTELMQAAMTNEKLAMLGRLSAGVAHEVANPLAYVLANLESLAEELSGEHAQMAEDARSGAQRIAKIVRDLRPLSRGMTESLLEDIDLAELAKETIGVARPRHLDVQLSFRSMVTLPVRCDRGRIEQALLNLVVNAMDAASGSGARVTVTTKRSGDEAIVCVIDNGPGVPMAVRNRLFEAFFTTKGSEGTGLGLFLSRSFVLAQGGDIRLVESNPGRTVFELALPLRLGVRSDPPPPLARRFLVVDDEEMIVRALGRLLSRHGDVVLTTDPHEALARASIEHFDLVLCDLHMPEMSGAEFVRQLAERSPEAASRVVILTGSQGYAPDGIRVLPKPVERAVLDRLVRSLDGAALPA
ncbi:MAG: ATP-binding protein [Myxococcota bacterium]